MISVVAAARGGFVPAMTILVVVIATDAWVYVDAKRQGDLGAPVVLTIGRVRIETPEGWLLACVLVWVIAFPLYLTGRRG